MSNNEDFKYTISGNEQIIEFVLNTKIYSLPVISQAAYFFLDKVYILLDGDPKKEIIVKMKLKNKQEKIIDFADNFYNELLNQLLRVGISKSNSKIREYIVSKALYNAVPNEVDELLKEVEEEDWQEDPLGIAQTWDEKNDESKK